MSNPRVKRYITRTIMLLAWTFFAITTVLDTHYLRVGDARQNTFSRPLDPFVIGMFLFAILTCGGCRFWLSRMRHPGWALIPYFLGLIFSWSATMYGIFLLPEFASIFQMISALFFFLYFPVLVRLGSSPPPLSKAR